MKPKIDAYTGTFLTQRQERLAVRKRFAELTDRLKLPRQVTFREINTASVKEKGKR